VRKDIKLKEIAAQMLQFASNATEFAAGTVARYGKSLEGGTARFQLSLTWWLA
jgi:hypothetical protein